MRQFCLFTHRLSQKCDSSLKKRFVSKMLHFLGTLGKAHEAKLFHLGRLSGLSSSTSSILYALSRSIHCCEQRRIYSSGSSFQHTLYIKTKNRKCFSMTIRYLTRAFSGLSLLQRIVSGEIEGLFPENLAFLSFSCLSRRAHIHLWVDSFSFFLTSVF